MTWALQRQNEERRVCHDKSEALTVMIRISQCPRLVGVKMSVSPDAWSREVGVGQKPPLPVKGRAVPMETGRENDGDVHVLLAVLQLAVGNLLEGQRGDVLPHVEGTADRSAGLGVPYFWSYVLYTEIQRKE